MIQTTRRTLRSLWLLLLEKCVSQPAEDDIKSAKRRMMFAVMDRTEGTWHCSIIHKICNSTWQILDKYGLSVLGTIDDSSNNGPSKSWSKIYCHPSYTYHAKAIADAKSSHPAGKDDEVFQSPCHKKLSEDVYLAQLKQGRKMSGKLMSATDAEIAVRTVVQFALHPVDCCGRCMLQ